MTRLPGGVGDPAGASPSGSRAAFGVQVENAPVPGAVVTYVYRQGPAELAGLSLGDRIEGIDGQPVVDAQSFSRFLAQLTPGRPVQVDVSRDGYRRSVSLEPRIAAEVFRSACDAGDQEGCASLGQRLRTGNAVQADPAEAREVLRRACDGGVFAACINLGNMYRTGQGGEADGAEAVRLFQRACDADVPTGCFNLGVVYLKGDGVTQDLNLSRRYFETACGMGDTQACRYAERAAKQE